MALRSTLFLTLAGVAIGVIAVLQNIHFYSLHGPFYDSMAYLNQLAWVMQQCQEDGFFAAIADSYAQSTVFLPWGLGALLAYVSEPVRVLGVFVQMPLIFLQLITGYRYFRVTGYSKGLALLYSLPLISFPALFNYNGGLGDFRMDLSQALAYGSFLAALMVARKRDSLSEWLFVGVVISVACLTRATSPVYVTAVLSIAFFLDLFKLGWSKSLQNYLLLGAVVCLLTGWFYLRNYDYLHYYYMVWNTDANARLPISQSMMHLSFVYSHLGPFLMGALSIQILIASFNTLKDGQFRLLNINWMALVGALMPILYLVLSGAGLNPFVSMLAVPGVILFFLHPTDCVKSPAQLKLNRYANVIFILLLSLSVVSSIRNSEKNVAAYIPTKQGVSNLVNIIQQDALNRNANKISLVFLYLGGVDDAVITNHLIYDRGFKYLQDRSVVGDGLTVKMIRNGFGAEVEWQKIPGMDDHQKLDYVFKNALIHADFIIMADQGSDLPKHHRINRYAESLRGLLRQTNKAQQLATGIELSASERVTVYRTNKIELLESSSR